MRYVVAAALVLLAVGLAPASAGPTARQPVLVFVSADVFESGARITPENVADLYLLKGNTIIRRLTRTPLWEEYPSWSPDGRRIAFSRGSPVCHALTCERRPGFYGMSIWVGRPGASARRITRTGDSYIDQSPMWSPNGRTIAFARVFCCEDDPSKDGIYTIAPDGKRQERIFKGRAKALDWSPDGSTIVFLPEFGGVRLLDVTAGDVTRPEITNLGGGKTDVAWSPDGQRLAVTAAAGIYVVEAEGGRARRVVRIRAGYEFGLGVSWSPDGRRIAFSGTLERNPEARPDIFVVGVNGRGLKRLTTNPGPDFDPQWRP
jgi:Tol biopolymer transport system component